MRHRAGRGGIGCLGSIALIGCIAYFGGRFVEPWLHYEQYRDAMNVEARFATTLTDSIIRIQLQAQADTLGLPPSAHEITIRRRIGRPPTVTISAEYSVKVDVPIFGIKVLHFKPSVEEPL